MKFRNRAILVGLGLGAAALASCGPGRPNENAEANWLTDPDKAVEAARQEGRPLFIAFLGSDWSSASEGAIKDVLNTKAFKDLADADLVLLKVDFARTGLTPEQTQSYTNLAKQLKVDHFPLFLIADPAHGIGTFSRINTYGNGGPVELVDQITNVLNEYRQVLAARLAQIQAQGQSAAAAPPPALPRVTGSSSYPSPEQMLQQSAAQSATNVPAGVSPAVPAQNSPPPMPAGFPSVQDMLNNKTPSDTQPAPSPAPPGNTDAPAFQLK